MTAGKPIQRIDLTVNIPLQEIQAHEYLEKLSVEYYDQFRQGDKIHPIDRIVMSIAEHESTGKAGRISMLALHFNNFGGIKHIHSPRYASVTFPPNEFETNPQAYRVYKSPIGGLNNIKWHLTQSTHYRKQYRDAMHNYNMSGLFRTSTYLHSINPIWCPPDKTWFTKVDQLLAKWPERKSPSSTNRA